MTSLPPLDSNIPTTKNPFDSVSMEIRVHFILEFGFGIQTEVQNCTTDQNGHVTIFHHKNNKKKI